LPVQAVVVVAVATKRRLFVYKMVDIKAPTVTDYAINGAPRSMTFSTPDVLFLTYSKEHVRVDLKKGVLVELMAAAAAQNGSSPISVVGGLGSGVVNVFSSAISFGYGASLDYRNNGTRLPGGEVLLTKENVSIYVGADGGPSRKEAMHWSASPEEVVLAYPFIVAAMPKRQLEVRNIGTQSLAQTMDMVTPPNSIGNPNLRFLLATSRNDKVDETQEGEERRANGAFLAGVDSLWHLKPVEVDRQIQELTEGKQYSEAVSVLDQVTDISPVEKAPKRHELQALQAHYLFRTGSLERAIALFQELDTDPAIVIGLFPESISGSLHAPDSPPIAAGAAMEEAISALIQYLTDRRKALMKRLSKLDDPGTTSRPVSMLLLDGMQQQSTNISAKINVDQMSVPELQAVLANVDTALFKSYMVTHRSMVATFARVQNWCRVDECAQLLLDQKLYRALVDLYHSKGLFRKALQLLAKLGKSNDQSEGGRFIGVKPTIQYLQKLEADHIELVLEFSKWVLEADPIAAMDIFTGDFASVDGWPRTRIADHLEEFSDDLAIQYLEHVIVDSNDVQPDIHTRLVLLYLEVLTEEMERMSVC
jgi:tetratricopeptide (TPR) repeat protein